MMNGVSELGRAEFEVREYIILSKLINGSVNDFDNTKRLTKLYMLQHLEQRENQDHNKSQWS